MIETHWQNMAELLEEGGYVMGGIFALSVGIYTLAFRTWIISRIAAQPYKQINDSFLPLEKLPNRNKYWHGFQKALSLKGPKNQEHIHFLATTRKKFARSLRAQLSLLKTLAASAPLLGLLGTLVGMIDTFDALSGNRAGDTTAMVAGGISKALLTTNAGLIVAIPAVLIAYLAKRKLEQALLVFSALENSLKRATPPTQ